MQRAWFAILVAALGCAEAQQYRQPPGVNPAQYQQGVPQQQFQPPPPPQQVPQQQMQGQVPQQQMQGQVPQQQMQGQVPQQQMQGQVPQQQMQGQVPQQGIPQQQFQPAPAAVPEQAVPQQGVPQQQFQRADGHAHGGHGQPQAMLRDKQQIAAEKDHIKEHLGAPIDTSGMSEQELQFHYFKMHDADGNDKLDGLELVASLQHWHDQSEAQPGQQQQAPQPKIFTDQELFELIDPIIDQDDRNRDGYIDYSEFMVAQQNAPPPPPASQGQQVA